jgi:hypothetical protein
MADEKLISWATAPSANRMWNLGLHLRAVTVDGRMNATTRRKTLRPNFVAVPAV